MSKKNEFNKNTKIYMYAVLIAWLTVLAYLFISDLKVNFYLVLFWGILHLLVDYYSIDLKRNAAVSLGFTATVAVIILYGPTFSALVLLFTLIPVKDILSKNDISILELLFNTAQNSLSAVFAALAYKSLGGLIFSESLRAYASTDFPFQLFPLISLILIYFFLNTALVVFAIAFHEKISIIDGWKINFSFGELNYIVLGVLGITFAQLFYVNPITLLLLAVPLAVSRQSFSRFMQLEKAYSQTIAALVKSIEAKDAYTRGHSDRVSDLCTKIARKLRMSEVDVEDIGRIAALHDIGKIGIPKNILTKESSLTDDEFSIIKEHPRIGARILKDVPFLQHLLPAVVYHHEKFDGTGYGAGLSGSNIPLYARIIAIADSYDAMNSDRSYRKALPQEVVIERILENCGAQFDKKIVRALFDVIKIELTHEQKFLLEK